ncbi:ATP-dependent zinc metalloprotease FtsH [Phaeocystidibacter marisrubri]|uniref:ATP-dependent zinc metalloprotease FtsH n=1 Tax=Phaeocystidibacter marisrubri TaxID=1577780 RepID=A0A6L3ZIM2_9FLAO|nr:ATP-dependent zinc metalloprotease FtsH [Phaeocystidibacter marisrubri]KAB2817030.1 ATP-dependent zinc metalloprotease FtsH [Phaeocystidibacter marisrubri]GGH77139.1 ATP-dependent zinc metalloprotease FtsH [Phaeocystidibacter marisrubri]
MENKDEKRQLDKLKEQFSKKNENGGGNRRKNDPKRKPNLYWVYGFVILFLLGINFFADNSTSSKDVNFHTLTTWIKANEVAKVQIVNKEEIRVFITDSALTNDKQFEDVAKNVIGDELNKGPHYVFIMPIESFETRLDNFYEENPQIAEKHGEILRDYRNEPNIWGDLIVWFVPLLFFVVIWIFLMRRMGGGAGGAGSQIFNIGKSKAQIYDKDTKVRVTFQNVAGMEGAKEEVLEIVDFLKNPQKYSNLGGKIPRGVLLSGPPGTGKTLLAKAVAGEAKVPFFSLSGSDFVEMFVGVGASRVRDLFRQAKEKSPCIIFIDEIDAIGRARGKSNFSGGNDERENTLNQLLTEMDGFGTNEHVIVMGATNRADILDRALMRAGRFDRLIYVDLPELNERKEIFQVHLKPIRVSDDIDVDLLARQTPGFSGADIANVCNEAALVAARKNKKVVEKQDFLDAVDRIVGGLEKKSKLITPDEKKTIAYHEAGHATVSWLLEHASPLVKVTIVPRGRSLGAAWYLPEERQITTAEQMLDEMAATLGGRAAEEVIFGKISTGALSDLEKVTKQARAMVTVYGLNRRIGNVTYYDSTGQNEFTFDKPYSEQTAQAIDEEIRSIIEEQYDRAVKLLSDNRDKLTELAETLLEKEVIFKENLEGIFGKRPWLDRAARLEKSEQDVAKPEAPKENVDSTDSEGVKIGESNVKSESDASNEDSSQRDVETS